MSEEVQTTLEFFFDEAPQTYFCNRCGQTHRAGECPKEKEGDKDG